MLARRLLVVFALVGFVAAVPRADAGILDWAKKTVRKATTAVKKVVKKARTAVKKVVKKVKSAVSRIVTKVVKIGKKAVAFLKTGYKTAAELWKQISNLKFPLIKQWKTPHKRVDLSKKKESFGIPVKDQGATTTCMAQALSTAMEYAVIGHLLKNKADAAKAGIRDPHGLTLSRRHIYYLSRHGMMICNAKTRMTGSWAAMAANWIVKDGTFRESLWPFEVWNPNAKGKYRSCLEAATNGTPPRAALAQRHFRIGKWNYLPGVPLPGKASVRRTGDIKAILAQGYPVVMTLFTFGGDQWKVDRKNPVVKTPKGLKMPDNAHYIALLGYDDAKGAFRFVNSWGPKWGQGGYGWLPYKYVSRYAIEGLFIRSVSIR